jgi:hypothetical protein
MSTQTSAPSALGFTIPGNTFKRKTSHQFKPNQWGRLEQFQVPCQLFTENRLSLSPNATKMLLFLYFKARGRYKQLQRYGMIGGNQSLSIVASQQDISRQTGCSRNTLTSVAKELVARKWIQAPASPLILKTAKCFSLSSSPGVNASIARWISRRFAPVPSVIRFLCAPYFTYAQNFASLAEKDTGDKRAVHSVCRSRNLQAMANHHMPFCLPQPGQTQIVV